MKKDLVAIKNRLEVLIGRNERVIKRLSGSRANDLSHQNIGLNVALDLVNKRMNKNAKSSTTR